MSRQARALAFIQKYTYREVQELVEDLTVEETRTFWDVIEDKWRIVALLSGRGGRGTMHWTSLLRKMTLFQRKAEAS